jgi:Leucine-rich repeat (LRR) protein
MSKEKIMTLINSDTSVNVSLGFSLAKSQGVDISELIKDIESAWFFILEYAQSQFPSVQTGHHIKDIMAEIGAEDYAEMLIFLRTVEMLYINSASPYNRGVPDSIYLLKNLEILSVVEGEVTYISPRIAELSELKVLRIVGYKPQTFPDISGLKNLKHLMIVDAPCITSIDVSELVNISILRINGCKQIQLPDISRLSKLRLLDISNTNIDRFPTEVLNLGVGYNYIEILLTGSKVTCLPDEIVNRKPLADTSIRIEMDEDCFEKCVMSKRLREWLLRTRSVEFCEKIW